LLLGDIFSVFWGIGLKWRIPFVKRLKCNITRNRGGGCGPTTAMFDNHANGNFRIVGWGKVYEQCVIAPFPGQIFVFDDA
jgi:hypothetical protein